jgi:hypothetical protein
MRPKGNTTRSAAKPAPAMASLATKTVFTDGKFLDDIEVLKGNFDFVPTSEAQSPEKCEAVVRTSPASYTETSDTLGHEGVSNDIVKLASCTISSYLHTYVNRVYPRYDIAQSIDVIQDVYAPLYGGYSFPMDARCPASWLRDVTKMTWIEAIRYFGADFSDLYIPNKSMSEKLTKLEFEMDRLKTGMGDECYNMDKSDDDLRAGLKEYSNSSSPPDLVSTQVVHKQEEDSSYGYHSAYEYLAERE